MGKKVVKTLYFVTGPAPNDEQSAEIETIPGQVCVRNATMIHDDDPLEDFDQVAGDVPPQYAAKAARMAAEAEGAPPPPKASTGAPAAPQGASAKPAAPGGNTAWKAN